MKDSRYRATSTQPPAVTPARGFRSTTTRGTCGVIFLREPLVRNRQTASSQYLEELLGASKLLLEQSTFASYALASETFGSRFQNASAMMAREEAQRQDLRIRLLNREKEGTLTPSERRTLSSLQLLESEKLEAELRPSIEHIRKLLGA